MDDKEVDSWLDFIGSDEGKEIRKGFLASLGDPSPDEMGATPPVSPADLAEARKHGPAVATGVYDMDAVFMANTVYCCLGLPFAMANNLILAWAAYTNEGDERAASALDTFLGEFVETLARARRVS